MPVLSDIGNWGKDLLDVSWRDHWFDGKQWAGKITVEKTVSATVHTGGAGAAGVGSAPFMMFGVGLAGAVSAVLSQMGYLHKREKLREQYKEEIAAKLGKTPDGVTDQDLDVMAEKNHAIGEEIAKQRKNRNYSIFSSTAAILLAVGMVGVLFAGVAAPALFTPLFFAKIIVGVTCHKIVEAPLEWIGNALFGLEHTTTHDHITGLVKEHKHGKTITREQVLGVFVSSNPELGEFIKAQYGQEYDKLGTAVKHHVADELEHFLPLSKMAASLNSGRISATELAFTVEGQVSGVLPKAPSAIKPTMLDKAGAALQSMGRRLGIGRHHQLPKADMPPQAAPVRPQRTVVEYDNGTPAGASFVKRLGLERGDTRAGYVAQLEQEALVASEVATPTVH